MARDIVDVRLMPQLFVRSQLTNCNSDEADIFLDSRGSKGDVYPEQNAMVSGTLIESVSFDLI